MKKKKFVNFPTKLSLQQLQQIVSLLHCHCNSTLQQKLRNIELSLQQYNSFEQTSFQKQVKQLMKELHVM